LIFDLDKEKQSEHDHGCGWACGMPTVDIVDDITGTVILDVIA
jgi:hypothetical protein